MLWLKTREQIYGYENPNTVIGWNITPVRQQLISSLMTLGAFVSSGTAGVLAGYLGRKSCLWVACAACIISNVIMMATTDIGALYVGRLIIGLANGYFMTFSQLYIQESSPAKYRGLFLTAFQFCTSFVSSSQIRYLLGGPSLTTVPPPSRAPSLEPSSTGRRPRDRTSRRT